ncbi:MAG: SUMF1/EgtB/PvdO family nonheme iron enzyme [Candidatus Dormibacteria bacterium]
MDLVVGADDSKAMDWEKPEQTHRIHHSYWIGRDNVTRGQCRALCTAAGSSEPEKVYCDDKLGGGKDPQPAIMVSWDDAKAYCPWARLVLPTEAE